MTIGNLPDDLRICAFCPNPCRGAVPESAEGRLETQFPSALSYLALALHEGYVRPDAEVAATLANTGIAEICRPACVYGFDVPGDLHAFLASSRSVEAVHG